MVFMKWDICWLPDSDSEGDPDKGIPGWHMWPSTGENTPNDGKVSEPLCTAAPHHVLSLRLLSPQTTV